MVIKQKESQDFNELAESILKSSQALQAFNIGMRCTSYSSRGLGNFIKFKDLLLLKLPNLVDFRFRVSLPSFSSEQAWISQILWIPSLQLQPPASSLSTRQPSNYHSNPCLSQIRGSYSSFNL